MTIEHILVRRADQCNGDGVALIDGGLHGIGA